jgi:Thymidylate synthase
LEITEATGSTAYVSLAQALLLYGHVASPRGLPTRELTDVTLTLTDPGRVHVLGTSRRPNLKIAATEAMHLVGGVSSLAQLDLASGGRFSRFADDGRLRGAYGPRTHSQLLAVEARLRRDPDSRQAVVTLWNGNELSDDSRDTPCTVSFQFLLRDGLLRMRTVMRSNDFWLGVPYDLMMFSCLHRTLAASLNVTPGDYVHVVGSMHVYETDVPKLRRIADDAGPTYLSDENLLVTAGIPIPPSWYVGVGSELEARIAYARRICLRDPGDGFLDAKHDTVGVPWLLSHVPRLPVTSYACDCGYVVPLTDGCEECGTREPDRQAEVVPVAARGRLVRPPELGSLPRPATGPTE